MRPDFALWLTASLAGYLCAIRAILPRRGTLLLAAAFPAVFVNIGHGQNGFLTAALLGGALHLIDRRPWLAGVLIGLLAYKPQFGVMIPLALVANQRWSSMAAAAATVVILVALSFAALGGNVWHAFINSMTFTQTVVLEQGGTGWEKIQSAFSAARNWGADVRTAYAIQLALALLLAASLAWLWHSEAAFELKASALATASVLATPYVLDYDLVVLAVVDCLPRPPRLRTRLSRLRDQSACVRLDRAAALTRCRRRHRNPAGADCDARPLCLHLAPCGIGTHGLRSVRASRRAIVIRFVAASWKNSSAVCSAVEVFDFFQVRPLRYRDSGIIV